MAALLLCCCSACPFTLPVYLSLSLQVVNSPCLSTSPCPYKLSIHPACLPHPVPTSCQFTLPVYLSLSLQVVNSPCLSISPCPYKLSIHPACLPLPVPTSCQFTLPVYPSLSLQVVNSSCLSTSPCPYKLSIHPACLPHPGPYKLSIHPACLPLPVPTSCPFTLPVYLSLSLQVVNSPCLSTSPCPYKLSIHPACLPHPGPYKLSIHPACLPLPVPTSCPFTLPVYLSLSLQVVNSPCLSTSPCPYKLSIHPACLPHPGPYKLSIHPACLPLPVPTSCPFTLPVYLSLSLQVVHSPCLSTSPCPYKLSIHPACLPLPVPTSCPFTLPVYLSLSLQVVHSPCLSTSPCPYKLSIHPACLPLPVPTSCQFTLPVYLTLAPTSCQFTLPVYLSLSLQVVHSPCLSTSPCPYKLSIHPACLPLPVPTSCQFTLPVYLSLSLQVVHSPCLSTSPCPYKLSIHPACLPLPVPTSCQFTLPVYLSLSLQVVISPCLSTSLPAPTSCQFTLPVYLSLSLQVVHSPCLSTSPWPLQVVNSPCLSTSPCPYKLSIHPACLPLPGPYKLSIHPACLPLPVPTSCPFTLPVYLSLSLQVVNSPCLSTSPWPLQVVNSPCLSTSPCPYKLSIHPACLPLSRPLQVNEVHALCCLQAQQQGMLAMLGALNTESATEDSICSPPRRHQRAPPQHHHQGELTESDVTPIQSDDSLFLRSPPYDKPLTMSELADSEGTKSPDQGGVTHALHELRLLEGDQRQPRHDTHGKENRPMRAQVGVSRHTAGTPHGAPLREWNGIPQSGIASCPRSTAPEYVNVPQAWSSQPPDQYGWSNAVPTMPLLHIDNSSSYRSPVNTLMQNGAPVGPGYFGSFGLPRLPPPPPPPLPPRFVVAPQQTQLFPMPLLHLGSDRKQFVHIENGGGVPCLIPPQEIMAYEHSRYGTNLLQTHSAEPGKMSRSADSSEQRLVSTAQQTVSIGGKLLRVDVEPFSSRDDRDTKKR